MAKKKATKPRAPKQRTSAPKAKAGTTRRGRSRLNELPDGSFGSCRSWKNPPAADGHIEREGDEFNSDRPAGGFEPWGGYEPWGGFEPWGYESPGRITPRWSHAKRAGARTPTGRRPVSLGWQPDVPDPRDHSPDDAALIADADLTRRAKQHAWSARPGAISLGSSGAQDAVPAWVDFRRAGWLPPVEDQESIGSCTAQAVVGVLETLANSVGGRHTDLSRLFLYKTTRNLLQWEGDTGAYIRSTIKATRLFGVPPEEHLPYDTSVYDEEPSSFLYQYASNYQATRYGRIDQVNNTGAQTLALMKRVLRSGYTFAFGFPVFDSIRSPGNVRGEVPFPRGRRDRQVGGHAVQAIGYSDCLDVEQPKNTRGGLIFRNSWGRTWGDAGFGYLPYEYVLQGLALDAWVIFNAEWVDDEPFA